MVVVLCHPCFGTPGGPERQENGSVRYTWPFSYFEQKELQERWGSFVTPFIFYHRSLSCYWKSFIQAGFDIIDFEEPTISPSQMLEIEIEKVAYYRMTPGSVAFSLRKK